MFCIQTGGGASPLSTPMKKVVLLGLILSLSPFVNLAIGQSVRANGVNNPSKFFYGADIKVAPIISSSLGKGVEKIYNSIDDFEEYRTFPFFYGTAFDLNGLVGYQFSPLLRCGLGVGLNFTHFSITGGDFLQEDGIRSISWNFISLPIFLHFQSRFLPYQTLSPIVEISGGYKIPLQYGKMLGYTSEYNIKGGFVEPSFGVSYYVSNECELRLSVFGAFRLKEPINYYHINYSSLGFKIGVII